MGDVDTESRQTHSNALARANDRQNDQHPQSSGQAGQTGAADRSDRFVQGFAENLERRVREGPRRSSSR